MNIHKKNTNNLNFSIFFSGFTFLILADQVSKYIVRQTGGFYICNKGIAFGINSIYILPLLLFSLLCLYLIYQKKEFEPKNTQKGNNKSKNFFEKRFLFFGIIILLSGAISNIIDRLYFGCVIDFINLKFWPVFNLADVFIVVGIFLIFFENKKNV